VQTPALDREGDPLAAGQLEADRSILRRVQDLDRRVEVKPRLRMANNTGDYISHPQCIGTQRPFAGVSRAAIQTLVSVMRAAHYQLVTAHNLEVQRSRSATQAKPGPHLR